MTKKPPAESAVGAAHLRAVVSQFARRLRALSHRPGLGTAKLSVLGHLYRRGPLTPTELAAREGVKLQSLTRLLAELEADDWIARRPHPSDGRQSVLSLTRQGEQRLVEDVREGVASLSRVMQAQLDDDDLVLLARACDLMAQLTDALEGEGAEPPSP